MIQFICFSKNRPLQLHGYLRSFFTHVRPFEQARMAVVLKTEPAYAEAYAEVLAEFSAVTVVHETDFAQDILCLMENTGFICFGCDDVVFVYSLDIPTIENIIDNTRSIGYTLRLGKNVVRGMFGQPMSQPKFWTADTQAQYIMWDATASSSSVDWAYPWEVLGTIYPTDFAQSICSSTQPGSPSQLEERGSRCWRDHTQRRMLTAPESASLVVPTVNIIQTEFGNGIVGSQPLSAEFLLSCWQNGLRMDTDRFAQHAYDSWRIGSFFLKRAP